MALRINIYSQYIYIILRNYQNFMNSSVFSACCNAFQSVDDSEADPTKVSRNIYKKNKTCQMVPSPKASLKYMSSNKNIKSFEDSIRQQNILMTSTVNVAQFPQTQNQVKVIQVIKPEISFLKVPIVEKVMYMPQSRPLYLTPSPAKQPYGSRTVQVQRVNFSYNLSKSQKISPRQPITSPFQNVILRPIRQKISSKPQQNVQQIYKDQGKLLKHSKATNELLKQINTKKEQNVVLNYPFQHILEPQNRNSLPIKLSYLQKKPFQQKEKKQAMQNRKTAPSEIIFNKYALGGSKFTVFSEQEVSSIPSEKDLPMVQSAILVNVFHPTNSQMKNWQVKKSKMSHIEQINNSPK